MSGQPFEPVRVGHAVRIGEDENPPGGLLCAQVARLMWKQTLRMTIVAHLRKVVADESLRAVVGRAVDNDEFKILKALPDQ